MISISIRSAVDHKSFHSFKKMSSPPSKKLRKNSRVPAAYGGIDSSWDESDSPHRRGDSRPAPSRTYYGVCMHQCHHLNLNVFFLFNIIFILWMHTNSCCPLFPASCQTNLTCLRPCAHPTVNIHMPRLRHNVNTCH